LPLAQLWGTGTTSSSDGQYYRAGGHGEALDDINARHGNKPGVTEHLGLGGSSSLCVLITDANSLQTIVIAQETGPKAE
jgi:hypothetical protein